MHDFIAIPNPRAFDLYGEYTKGVRMVGGEELRGDLPAGTSGTAGATDQGNEGESK